MSDAGKSALSVTLKEDGKDGMWVVAYGSPADIKADLIEAYGMSGGHLAEMTMHDVAKSALALHKAVGTVGRVLGGRTGPPSTSGSSDVWTQAREEQAQPAEPEKHPAFGLIEQADTVDAVKLVYAQHKAAFDADPELVAAYKAKGKALTQKAAEA